MTRWSLRVACGLPVLLTAITLGAVQWNRGGGRGPIELTERELALQPRSADNTAATLSLSWEQADRGEESQWLTREKLVALGFRCDVDPSSAAAEEYYRDVLPRPVFIALEHDGPAWQRWVEHQERQGRAGNPSGPLPEYLARRRDTASRLVAVDADSNATVLEAKYPDARRHVIAAGVVRLFLNTSDTRRSLVGLIEGVEPGEIHVPADLAAALPSTEPAPTDPPNPRYTVTLRYGRRYEPWVIGIKAK